MIFFRCPSGTNETHFFDAHCVHLVIGLDYEWEIWIISIIYFFSFLISGSARINVTVYMPMTELNKNGE